ncbi:MAG: glutathione peroxidase [Saprospiraceae bacterium]|nr:glutathione peroxidase [Saprospiraceae bacterium]
MDKNKLLDKNIYDYSILSLTGEKLSMKDYQGKVLLLVNTASECGFTPQLGGLEHLYEKYKDKGLVVIGFPCNQFGQQEPGDASDISKVCHEQYGVSFPMTQKIEVNGSGADPIFRYLTSMKPGFLSKKIKWNFTKFVVDTNGIPVKRFAPWVKPEKIGTYLEKNFFKN